MIVIVGAGLAGLTCARVLLGAGKRVCVFESAESVGGRLKTRVTAQGYRIDFGYQALFAAYPALRRHVRLADLAPRYFGSSATVMIDGRESHIGHPLFSLGAAARGLRRPLIAPKDASAVVRVAVQSRSLGDGSLPAEDQSTRSYLANMGVSASAIDNLFAPLFGGISFDRSLSTSSSFFRFVLRNLAVGRVFIPARGIGELPALLVKNFPADCIRLGTAVDHVVWDGGRVVGVQTSNGAVGAEAIVVATEAPVAARLTGTALPLEHRSTTAVCFSSIRPLYDGSSIVLNARESLVNEVVQLTNVSSLYSPEGHHLSIATVLSEMSGTDDSVASLVLSDLHTWLPAARRTTLEPVAVTRIAFAQFSQPPGIYARLPSTETDSPGLFLAGEYLHSSSVQGAMRSGEMAAHAVLRSTA